MAVYRPTYRDQKTGKWRKSKTWWYEFTFAGKRVRESAKTTRKTIATEAERNRRIELEKALAGIPTEKRENRILTVADALKTYETGYALTHRAKSVAFSKSRLAHVKRLLGSALLPDLTEERIHEYIKARLDEKACGRTINMELGELSRAIGKTWRELWPKVRKLEERQDVGRALSPEEESRLLQTAAADESPNRNPVLYTFLRVALTTGMRSGEIITLTWGQVDLEKHVITVGRAKTSSGTGRQIPMNAELQMAMEAHAVWFAEKVGPIQPEWYVFPGRLGRPKKGVKRPLDPTRPTTTIKSSWKSLRTDAKVQCRPHDLRHTAATKMAEAGVPESTMLSLMGHMSRAMLERYSHIRMQAKRVAVESLTLVKPKAGGTAPRGTIPSGLPQDSPQVARAS